MTGKFPPRFGITDYMPGGRSGKLLPAPNADHLPLEEVTIAETLRDAGYATFFAGKWQLGGGEFSPNAQGFGPGLTSGEGNAKANVQFWYPPSDTPVPDHKDDPKTFYETPNIDGLAKRGMRFTQGYSACCHCASQPRVKVRYFSMTTRSATVPA